MHYIVPVPKQYVDFSGVPYSDGTVTVYLHGKEDLAKIFADAGTDTLAQNPSTLDSNGSWLCFVTPDESLDYIVKDRDGNVVASFIDIVVPGLDIEGGVTKEYVDDSIAIHDDSHSSHQDIRDAINAIPIVDVDENLDPSSSNPVENRAVDAALRSKQDELTEMTDQEVDDLIAALN